MGRRLSSAICCAFLLLGLFADSANSQPPPPNMEVGSVSGVDQNFQNVQFQSNYDVAPVVFTLLPNDNGSPSILRIRDVTTSGFSIAQLEADNAGGGATTPSTVSYFAIEPGSGTIGGLEYVAGTHTTTT